MRTLCTRRRLVSSRYVRSPETISRPYVSSAFKTSWRPALLDCHGALLLPVRGAKTKASVKVQDLPQGVIGNDPLPELEADDAPQYPAVVQGAKNNMIKFSNCVVLTRVGSFYEVVAIQDRGPYSSLTCSTAIL
jgi:hypothetical protein